MNETSHSNNLEITSEDILSEDMISEVGKLIEEFEIDENTPVQKLDNFVQVLIDRHDINDEDLSAVIVSFDVFASFHSLNDKDQVKKAIEEYRKKSKKIRKNH